MKAQKLACGAILLELITAGIGQADVVTVWNRAGLDAIRAGKTPPPIASRMLAILHASIYDAVTGILRTSEPYLVPSACLASTSIDAAVSATAHEVLVTLDPANSAEFDTLHAATLAAVPDGPQKSEGVRWGEWVASQILAFCATDGYDTSVPPPSRSGPGYWIPTPPAFAPYLLPQWGFVRPFVMSSSSQFRPPGPPALDSAKWAADYNEIKALGAKINSTRTPDQGEIALFWADGAGTETPPGHWNSIAQQVGAALGNTVAQNARLFALLNLAMADAAICACDAKYTFDFWRPVTAIRNGASDGNPATDPDPTWDSFIITPPFPDYVSGHSTFSGAASTVLALFYGTDHVPFTIGSDFLPGVTRRFGSFSAAAEESGSEPSLRRHSLSVR
jgi:hypothetical protein